jgi:hypothetical protein
MMSSKWVVVIVAAVLLCGLALAQTTKGGIAGTVKDQNGAVVNGATVKVVENATGLERGTTTADNGSFRVPLLPNGSYTLTVTAQGFAAADLKDIAVNVDQTRTVDVVVHPAGRAETVTVTSDVEEANTETSQLGQVIDNTKVVNLPLNGRNFAQLARLNPGVAASGGGGGQQGGEGGVSGFSSNGQRSSSNNFMIDGVDNNSYFSGEVAQLPSIDSIQEFEVQTNTFAAEYGRNSGSVVNLVTKSGTNQLHGSVFEFLRNDIFDARNFFNSTEFDKPKLRLNQFGATLGGPIIKDRTFFFVNYEGFRQRAGITRITNVPTLAERGGHFTDQNGNPVDVTVDPTSAQLFALFPEPNLNDPTGNYVASPILTNGTDQGLIKIDHRLRTADTVSLRYSHSRSDIDYPYTPGQSGTNIPGYGLLVNGGTHLASISYTRILTAKTLNEFRFGFTRTVETLATEAGPRAATFGFNTGLAPDAPLNLGNIPQIVFSGGFVSGGAAVSNLGGAIDQPNSTAQNTFQFVDNISHTTARHAWKFGADIRRTQLNRLYDLSFSGQIIFGGANNTAGPGGANVPNALIDFAQGLPSGSLIFTGDSHRGFRTTSYNFFAQDSFKIRPNLTLNYGLRYELNTVLHDVTNRLSTFRPDRYQHFLDPNASQTDLATLEQSGVVTQNDIGGIYDGDHNNFAPRIGIVWALGQQAKTVVRAGYGIFYDTVIGNIPGNIMLNPPYLPGNFNVFAGWPAAFAPAGFPVLTVTEQHFRSPYAQHYNLDIQRALAPSLLLEVSYVGSKGTFLPRFRQINQAYNTPEQIATLTPDVVTRMELMGIPPFVAQFLATNIALIPSVARTPFFGIAQIFTAQDSESSGYNSFQTKLDKRFSHGLTFLLSYTWAKSIDSSSVFFGSGANGTTIFPQNNYDLQAERGLSDFDIRHRLSWSFVYEMPKWNGASSGFTRAIANGWQLGGILTLQTGQPFSVLTGADNSGTGLGNDRPDLVGNPNAGPKTVSEWFNTAAFVQNAPLTFGNSGRNIVEGPGFHNFDFALVKNTPISERVNTQFRAEFFNLTNHPNFALPSNVLLAPNFGALYQTPDAAQNNVGLGSGGPRLVQFGLKVTF